MSKIVDKITEIRNSLDEPLSLAAEGLLKSERLHGAKHAAEDELKLLAQDLDERTQLTIEKNIPIWRKMPKHGVFVKEEEALRELAPLMGLLDELREKLGVPAAKSLGASPKNEVIIVKGRPFDGRRYLRALFEQATSELFVRDPYARPAILDVLSEFVFDGPDLRVRILIGDNNRRAAFEEAARAFHEQYEFPVEVRFSTFENSDHPRYIVVDGQQVYNPDHSLDQWGYSTTHIHLLTTGQATEEALKILENEWDSAAQSAQ